MKFVHALMLLTLLFIVVAGAAVLWPNYLQCQSLRNELSEKEKLAAEQQREIMQLKQEIEGLRKDPRSIERVAREKFGWCRDNEKIYHFDSSGGLGPTTTPSRTSIR